MKKLVTFVVTGITIISLSVSTFAYHCCDVTDCDYEPIITIQPYYDVEDAVKTPKG